MFNNMAIKSRLMLVIGMLSVLLVAVGGLGLYGIDQSNGNLKTVYEDRTIVLADLGSILDRMHRNRFYTDVAANPRDIGVVRQRAAAMTSTDTEIDVTWQKFMSTTLIPEEERLANVFAQQWPSYKQVRDTALGLAMTGNFDAAATTLSGEGTRQFEAVHQTMLSLIELQAGVAGQEYAEAQSNFSTIFSLTAVMVGLGVLLAIIIGVLLVRAVVGPLNEAISVANAVASGDLTSRIDVTSNNETGRLLQALKTMNDNLVDLVGKVRSSTDQITTASGEIASGNLDLSQRTEEQASSLEETASSMEELTSTVKQNSDNARQANQLAAGASDIAVKGGEVVGQVVQTMSAINDSSKKIVDIISVIDGIAFQTNILALNAAVEAARAGEQGRGFAVVATEVRTLAQRSAAAAKEIKELISDSVAKVEDGTRLVDEAGATMDEIVNAVKRVTDIMSEISAASHEQSSGIEQVNQAVTQMDEVTQQNAALVEQAAAAAESMNDQAQTLTQAISVFKLSGSGYSTSAPAKRSNRAAVSKLPNRGTATKKAASPAVDSSQPRKAAAGGGSDSWEEF